MAILTALYLGSRLPADLGIGVFYTVLGLGWAAVLIWTLLTWGRGEKGFLQVNRND